MPNCMDVLGVILSPIAGALRSTNALAAGRPCGSFRAGRAGDYARTPENGQLPSAPALIFPDILSPSTAPVNCSVNGIGLVIDIFQDTSLPLTVPSKMSVVLPSPDCLPVSVPPCEVATRAALRSPIGVCLVKFQVPSTAMSQSSLASETPEPHSRCSLVGLARRNKRWPKGHHPRGKRGPRSTTLGQTALHHVLASAGFTFPFRTSPRRTASASPRPRSAAAAGRGSRSP